MAGYIIYYICSKQIICLFLSSDYPVFRSFASYPSDEQSQPRARCAECGLQLCTLAQLRAAYEAGFRHSGWYLYDKKDRVAMVSQCGKWRYVRNECYYEVEGNRSYTESLIPNIRRPGRIEHPICCQKCQVDTSK